MCVLTKMKRHAGGLGRAYKVIHVGIRFDSQAGAGSLCRLLGDALGASLECSEIFWTPREARVIENMAGAVSWRTSHVGLGSYA